MIPSCGSCRILFLGSISNLHRNRRSAVPYLFLPSLREILHSICRDKGSSSVTAGIYSVISIVASTGITAIAVIDSIIIIVIVTIIFIIIIIDVMECCFNNLNKSVFSLSITCLCSCIELIQPKKIQYDFFVYNSATQLTSKMKCISSSWWNKNKTKTKIGKSSLCLATCITKLNFILGFSNKLAVRYACLAWQCESERLKGPTKWEVSKLLLLGHAIILPNVSPTIY